MRTCKKYPTYISKIHLLRKLHHAFKPPRWYHKNCLIWNLILLGKPVSKNFSFTFQICREAGFSFLLQMKRRNYLRQVSFKQHDCWFTKFSFLFLGIERRKIWWIYHFKALDVALMCACETLNLRRGRRIPLNSFYSAREEMIHVFLWEVSFSVQRIMT